VALVSGEHQPPFPWPREKSMSEERLSQWPWAGAAPSETMAEASVAKARHQDQSMARSGPDPESARPLEASEKQLLLQTWTSNWFPNDQQKRQVSTTS
jgi:hypothetical protein